MKLFRSLKIKEKTTIFMEKKTAYFPKLQVHVLVTQGCPNLCNLTDCSPPGFSVHGILQARVLE